MRLQRIVPAGLAIITFGAVAFDYPYIPYDHAAIEYPTRTPDDAITRLQQKIDSGDVKLDFDMKFGLHSRKAC